MLQPPGEWKSLPSTTGAFGSSLRFGQTVRYSELLRWKQSSRYTAPLKPAVPKIADTVPTLCLRWQAAHMPRVAWAWTRSVSRTLPGAVEVNDLPTAWEVAALFRQGLAAAAVRDRLLPAASVLLESMLDSQAAATMVRKGYLVRSEPTTEMCRTLALIQERHRVRIVLRWVRRWWNWQACRLSHPETVELSSLGSPPTARSKLTGEDFKSHGPRGIWRCLELDQATGGSSSRGDPSLLSHGIPLHTEVLCAQLYCIRHESQSIFGCGELKQQFHAQTTCPLRVTVHGYRAMKVQRSHGVLCE